MELFYAEGPQVVRDIKARGHKIFLDLKLHDIPNTVKRAMAVLSRLDVDMVNLHAAGTSEMMKAALEGLTRPDGSRPLLIAVTQLTSTDAAALKNELLIAIPMAETVLSYAKNAASSGLDGVVCSPLEAALVKERCGADFLTVTPRHPVRRQRSRRPEADHDPGEGRQVRLRLHRGGPPHHPGGGPGGRLSESGQGLFWLTPRQIKDKRNPVTKEIFYLLSHHDFRTNEEDIYMNLEREIAHDLLSIGAVFLRPDEPFTWASGIKSPIYCDNRLTLTAPAVRTDVEKGLVELIRAHYPDAEVLMGTSTAGIAHAAIVGHLMDLPMGYVRSGNKDHGRQNRIEGRLEKGQKVVVVEDLISTAGSCIEVVEALREAGAEVLGIVSIFTYGLQKGLDRLAAANVTNWSLSNFDAVCEVAAEEGKIRPEDIERLKKFRANPSDESWIAAK